MSSTKYPQQHESPSDETKSKINRILDTITAQAGKETQFDSFYEKAAEELKAADSKCMPVITRRILRAEYREKEILLRILKYFKGVEHIQFLQDMLNREVITARMGRIILDIFNKSDMILESGTASRLLDLDALSQKIIHGVLSGSIDDGAVQLFATRPEREQEGIMIELLQEAGAKSALFIAKLFETNKPAAQKCLKFAVAEPTEASYGLLTDIYALTGNKEILKTAKKIAHTLKQHGVLVAEEPGKKPQQSVFKSIELPEPRAFTTMIDAEGYRLLFMLKPISPHEIKIFNIMLNQETGIADIEAITALRRESKQLVQNLLGDKKIEFVEISVSHAAFLLLEAAAVNERKGAVLSPVMLQWRSLFADLLPAPDKPIIHTLYTPAESRSPSPDSSAALLDNTEIPYWFIATDFARQTWQGLRSSGTDFSEQDQQHCADAFFTETRLQVFCRRLEELAYMLHLKGRPEQAQAAWSLSRELAAPGLNPSGNPFCREIIRRGFEYFKTPIKTSSGS